VQQRTVDRADVARIVVNDMTLTDVTLDWSPLPDGFSRDNWVGCDQASEDLFFERAGVLLCLSLTGEGWQNKIICNLHEQYGSSIFVQPLLPSGHGFVVFNVEQHVLHLIRPNGNQWAGPYVLPVMLQKAVQDRIEFVNDLHKGEVIFWGSFSARLEASSPSPPTRLYVSGGNAVHCWNLVSGLADCLVGQSTSFGTVDRFVSALQGFEGFGPVEGFGSTAIVSGDIVAMSDKYMFLNSGLSMRPRTQRLDLQSHELRCVNFVGFCGAQLCLESQGCPVISDSMMDSAGNQLMVLHYRVLSTSLSSSLAMIEEQSGLGDVLKHNLLEASIVDISVDLCKSSLQAELANVNWGKPARLVVLEVGESGDRVEIDSRVLKARCPHFSRALCSGMQESLTSTPFCLQDVSKAALQQFASYLYTDTVDLQAMDETFTNITVQLSQLGEDGKLGIVLSQSACITDMREELRTLSWKDGDRVVAINGREVWDKVSLQVAKDKANQLAEKPVIVALQRPSDDAAALLKSGLLCIEVHRLADRYCVLRLQKLALCALQRQGGRGGWRFRIAVRTPGPPHPRVSI